MNNQGNQGTPPLPPNAKVGITEEDALLNIYRVLNELKTVRGSRRGREGHTKPRSLPNQQA
jgi:hypothetical protein